MEIPASVSYPLAYEMAVHTRRLAKHSGWPWLVEKAQAAVNELTGNQEPIEKPHAVCTFPPPEESCDS